MDVFGAGSVSRRAACAPARRTSAGHERRST